MKIEKILRVGFKYEVHLIPNWLEKLFGIKPKVETYKDSGYYYPFGGQSIYYDEEGDKTSNRSYIAEAIDKFRRK